MAIAEKDQAQAAVSLDDIDALLEQSNTKRVGEKAADKHPVIAGHESLADAVVAAKRHFKDAEAQLEILEMQARELAYPEYEKQAKAGQFSKSIAIKGADTEGVMVAWSDRFSAIDTAKLKDLKAADPDFDRHFRVKRELALKKTDNAAIAEVMALLGKDKFAALFDVKLSIVTQPGMDEKQFGMPADGRVFLNQYKATVKAR